MGLRGPKRNPNSRRGRAEAALRAKMESRTGPVQVAPAIPSAPAAPTLNPAPEQSEAPTCPTWLSERQAAIWRELVNDLMAARVPLARVDSHAIAMAAYCLAAIDEWTRREQEEGISIPARLGMSKLIGKYQRDAQAWLVQIGATPGARSRLDIAPPPKKHLGPLAMILAAKQARMVQ